MSWSKLKTIKTYNSGRDLRSRVDRKLKLGLLAIINRQTFHQQRGESGASSSTKRVEDQESLQAGTVVSSATNTIQNGVNDFLADRVVSSSVVVSCILLSVDQLLGMEQLLVGSGANFIYKYRLL